MLSLVEIARRIDAGETTPERAINDAAARIRAQDREVQAVVCLDENARILAAGPLRGIAVGIKDILDVAGLPTTCGSPLYRDHVARTDAAVTALLRRAGATPLAKTATTPFAYLDPTATANPAAPGRTPGGSSSGSAAAVAAGFLPLAIGTQTGGSVIRPASFCGIAGMKPSYRLIPTVGAKCYSWTFDTVGLFAAGIRDVAFALAAITGRDGLKPAEEPGSPRIGIVTQDFAAPAEPEAIAALEHAARSAERAGARVSHLSLPAEIGEAWAVHATLQDFEARQALAYEYDNYRAALPPLLQGALDRAAATTPDEYDAARRKARRARQAMAAVFAEVDALLTFAAPGPAPASLASTGDARFNRVWTMTGDPCVAIPSPTCEVPVGVQVIARFGRDDQALAIARFIEKNIAK